MNKKRKYQHNPHVPIVSHQIMWINKTLLVSYFVVAVTVNTSYQKKAHNEQEKEIPA